MRLFIAAMSGIACGLLLNPALGAESCISPIGAMALKTAGVQQQLMVAAFMCGDANEYNRFVRAYQADLQKSDGSLKAYFVHRFGRRGEAAYDTYKTKAANLAGLSQARNDRAFCGAADRLFAEARQNRGSLSSFIEDAPSPPGFRNVCVNPPAEANPRTRLHIAQARSLGSR